MKLDEFMIGLNKEVENFEQTWREENKEDPVVFPLELSGSEWVTEFRHMLQPPPTT